MSIADKAQQILVCKSDIKDAIESKGVVVGNIPFDEYAGKIEEIVKEEAPENDVCFYDYDGKRVASFTIAEAKALTQAEYDAILPPAHEGLTFQEWNWSLADIQSYNRRYANIGANYITTDGQTHLFLDSIPDGFVMYIFVSVGTNTITISWGDGSSENVTGNNQTASHTYSTGGDYDIAIKYNGSEGTSFTLPTPAQANRYTLNYISEIRVGNGCNISAGSTFAFWQGKYISLPTGCAASLNQTFRYSCVNMVVLPKGFGSNGVANVFLGFMGNVCFPKASVSDNSSNLFTIYTKRLILPESQTSSSYSFSGNHQISVLSLPNSTTYASGTSFFNTAYNITNLDIVQDWKPSVNLNLSPSTKYTTEAIVDFFNKLGNTATTITLTFGSYNLSKVTEAQKQIATDKGYTLA